MFDLITVKKLKVKLRVTPLLHIFLKQMYEIAV